MRNDLKAFIYVFIILVFGSLILYGCGANPTSSGEDGAGTNQGTISGTIYIAYLNDGTYVPTSDAIVTVSTEAMSSAISYMTGANGKYKLTGLPKGEIAISVTKEGRGAYTMVANSSIVDMAIDYVSGSLPTGDATIKGTIEGITGSFSSYSFTVRPLSGKSYFAITDFMVDYTTGTFEINDAPDDGWCYVMFRGSYDGTNFFNTYGKVYTSSGQTTYATLELGSEVTVEAKITPPTGYAVVSVKSWIANGIKIYNSLRLYNQGLVDPVAGERIVTLEGLPELKYGDTYYLEIRATNEAGNLFWKNVYGRTEGGQLFNYSSMNIPNPSFTIWPVSGETVSGVPTFEWEALPDTGWYSVNVSGGPDDFGWTGSTTRTKITMPAYIAARMTAAAYYNFSVNATRMENYQPTTRITNPVPTYKYNYYLGSDSDQDFYKP